MATRPALSLCMIVRDEAASLSRCLRSVEGIVDEMIVVDTGSSDDTVAIAASHGARVERFEWVDDFAAARNRSLGLARGRWALVLDADEELAAGSGSAVRSALRVRGVAGYNVPLRNLLDGARSTQLFVCRLFRLHASVRYEYAIHEQVLPSLARFSRSRGHALAVLKGAEILHHGYLSAVVTAKKKEDRNDRLFRKQLARTPNDAYVWWKFGEHLCKHGRIEKARPALEQALALIRARSSAKPSRLPYAAPLCALLAVVHEQQGETLAALEVCRYALSVFPPHPDTLTTAARLLLASGEIDQAEALYRQAHAMDEGASEAGGWPGSTTVRPATGLGEVARARGDRAEARRWYEAALADDPGFDEAALGLAELDLQEGRTGSALSVLTRAVQRQPRSFCCWKRGASLWRSLANRPRALVWYTAAHRLGPADGEVRWELGLLALGGGDAEMALGLFEGAMRKEPRCALAMALLALAVGEPLEVDIDLGRSAADVVVRQIVAELALGSHVDLLEGLRAHAPVVADPFPELPDLVDAALPQALRATSRPMLRAG